MLRKAPFIFLLVLLFSGCRKEVDFNVAGRLRVLPSGEGLADKRVKLWDVQGAYGSIYEDEETTYTNSIGSFRFSHSFRENAEVILIVSDLPPYYKAVYTPKIFTSDIHQFVVMPYYCVGNLNCNFVDTSAGGPADSVVISISHSFMTSQATVSSSFYDASLAADYANDLSFKFFRSGTYVTKSITITPACQSTTTEAIYY
jgi:hypothetical protein